MGNFGNNLELPELLHERLAGHKPVFSGIGRREAAILIPLLWKNDEWHVLYEVRAKDLDAQPGEICFPGGAVEEEESPLQAARRETVEELLIDDRQIDLIGPMDAVMGPSGAPIWIYTGVLYRYEDSWSEDEVDHTFTVPLRTLLDMEPIHKTVALKTIPPEDFPYDLVPGGREYPWHEKHQEVWFYPVDGHVIWGITGGITQHFLQEIQKIHVI